jgi:peptide subunit release factor RF-3
MEPAPIFSALWLQGEPEAIRNFQVEAAVNMALDKRGRMVYLCPNEYRMQNMEKNHPCIRFMKLLQE